MLRGTCPFIVSDPTAVAQLLIDANGRGGVIRHVARGARGRIAYLTSGTETVVYGVDSDTSWQERLAHLREAITALPHRTDQACIRFAKRLAMSWVDADVLQPYGGIGEVDVRYNKHLVDRYVADANGIQVLREEHLANARDLSCWNITDLGHGRHLVEHPDLAAWYADGIPDASLIAQARDDFGPMILTQQDDHRDPQPWSGL